MWLRFPPELPVVEPTTTGAGCPVGVELSAGALWLLVAMILTPWRSVWCLCLQPSLLQTLFLRQSMLLWPIFKQRKQQRLLRTSSPRLSKDMSLKVWQPPKVCPSSHAGQTAPRASPPPVASTTVELYLVLFASFCLSDFDLPSSTTKGCALASCMNALSRH